MNLTTENIVLIGSVLLLLSVLAGKTSYKFGVPTLILFLLVGILAGSEGIGKIAFNNPGTAQFIGIISLNYILFSGGLDTNWTSIKPILGQGISLSTVGVLLTAILLGLFVWYVTDFTFFESMLLGSIVSSTDAAAVFSILRSKSLALKDKLRPTLELESGSNDPMAYVLTLAFLGLVLNPDLSPVNLAITFFQQMTFGFLLGIGFGWFTKTVINKINLGFEGLYPVLVISLMFITFSFTNLLGGNGFLAVYLCAVYLGNQELIHKKTILKMFDGLAWLMQIVLFLTLGLLVNPSEIIPFLGVGILISLFLIIVARPVSVFIALLPFKMSSRRRWYISWVGLRGAVPIVFATYPLIAGIEKAHIIFNIVFFVSLTSVLIQGTTLTIFAKWLNVLLPEKEKQKNAWDLIVSDSLKRTLTKIELGSDSTSVGKKIVELGFPKTAIIAVIKRNGAYITPTGNTELKKGDLLMVLAEGEKSLNNVCKSLGIPSKSLDEQNEDSEI